MQAWTVSVSYGIVLLGGNQIQCILTASRYTVSVSYVAFALVKLCLQPEDEPIETAIVSYLELEEMYHAVARTTERSICMSRQRRKRNGVVVVVANNKQCRCRRVSAKVASVTVLVILLFYAIGSGWNWNQKAIRMQRAAPFDHIVAETIIRAHVSGNPRQ